MREHSHITAADFNQTEEQKLLVFAVSDDALEKAAGGTPPAHPGTGVATICVREPPYRWGAAHSPRSQIVQSRRDAVVVSTVTMNA